MPATPIRSTAPRFARFILQRNVASRRYIYSFWNPQAVNGKLKPGATDNDVAKYALAVIANEGSNQVRFRSVADMGPSVQDVVYVTDSLEIANLLRSEIRSGRLKAREDVTVAPLVCAWCDYSLPSSTDADREVMYTHYLDNHPEKLEDGLVRTPLATLEAAVIA